MTVEELDDLGFSRFDLRFLTPPPDVAESGGCTWDTMGVVPDTPGHYLFTIEQSSELHVAYVGLTENLWMITKGRLSDGRSRPAQRYGRPKYAGATRARINGLIAAEHAAGRVVAHWLRPLADPPSDRAALRARLLADEEALIRRWSLRQNGWNRG